MTNMTVLVTGASGTLGGAVVPQLIKVDDEVRPMSRRARPEWVAADLASGEGVVEAVRGGAGPVRRRPVVHPARRNSRSSSTGC
jgi:uncharacterized protein YbjT (DUF2867 family)